MLKLLLSISELHQGFFSLAYVIRLMSLCMSHENFQPYLVLSPSQTIPRMKGPRIDRCTLAGEDGKYSMSILRWRGKNTWRLKHTLTPLPTPPSPHGNEHTWLPLSFYLELRRAKQPMKVCSPAFGFYFYYLIFTSGCDDVEIIGWFIMSIYFHKFNILL